MTEDCGRRFPEGTAKAHEQQAAIVKEPTGLGGRDGWWRARRLGVGRARQDTARERRALIIRTLEEYLGHSGTSALRRLAMRLDVPHVLIAGSDIDGILSAMMVGSVAAWRVAALVMPNGSVLLAPGHEDLAILTKREDVFGVDVYSPHFPSVSNHPVLFGTSPRTRPEWLRAALHEFDGFIEDRTAEMASLNLSIWAGIGARLDEHSPRGYPYKYPLGTAQFLLALLELVGRPPRFYDREYLPWLVADCDGGLDSIREYHWNVELWWSALAAVAGPASLSEAVFQLATNQRATQFVDVDLRLRRDYGERAEALNSDWNLSSETPGTIAAAASLIRDISGWPDPFVGGAEGIAAWRVVSPTRNVLYLNALTKQPKPLVEAHLECAREAVHVNFSRFFEKGTYLGWMLSDHRPAVEARLGRTPSVNFLKESDMTNTAKELFAERTLS